MKYLLYGSGFKNNKRLANTHKKKWFTIQASLAEGRHTNHRKKDQESKITSSTGGRGASRESPPHNVPKTSSQLSYGRQILSSLTHYTIHIFSPLFSPGYWHRNQLLLFSLCFSLSP